MTRFFHLERGDGERQKGTYKARHKWGLPGVTCPLCHATWASTGFNYPALDLTSHPAAKKLAKAYLEKDFDAYEGLREQVRPLLPPDSPLLPGALFGPLVGTARGPFAAFLQQYGDVVLVRPDALARLQSSGLRGLKGVRTELRFRPKDVEELLELAVEPRGLLHPDCIPRSTQPACPKCGRHGFSLPKEPILDASSLPLDLDLMRLRNFAMVLVVTQRFKDAVEQLGLDGLTFRELPVR
ncbi:hypothetical protein HUW62_18460 [Myxococcus sp. AM011]|uniref:SitI6 family double-CXXCG motif immunity protein n=1 Tax=Myxococcus sp. AM011 TaxID=2745200 RepID=UPI0015951ABB|nr:double-CXXCG motif protein [Myxococcus sp. AM011]NVJ23208.1 hypothetical protein [Myxococcus sp. AM011]